MAEGDSCPQTWFCCKTITYLSIHMLSLRALRNTWLLWNCDALRVWFRDISVVPSGLNCKKITCFLQTILQEPCIDRYMQLKNQSSFPCREVVHCSFELFLDPIPCYIFVAVIDNRLCMWLSAMGLSDVNSWHMGCYTVAFCAETSCPQSTPLCEDTLLWKPWTLFLTSPSD